MIEMNAGTRAYSIKDLEGFCGIKAHTIRMWEKRYGILQPDRSESNIRSYSEEELKKLITVAILNRNGLKISRIARLSDTELLREVMQYGSGDEGKNGGFKPGELIMSALRFSEEEFRQALQPFIAESGPENAYVRVFHPLMQKARTLWLTDCLSKPQEQFIRHVIKSLIIAEDLDLEVTVTRETVAIINLGESEAENNLIFLKYLLRKRGFDVVYTEGTLSAAEIEGIHSIKPFTVLALNIPASEPDREVKDFCAGLTKELKLKKVLVTGRYENSGSWSEGRTEVSCSPAALAAWADKL